MVDRDLRPRDQLRPPTGLSGTLEHDQKRQLAQINRKRNGKKGSITRRIKEIEHIIEERGSRTKIQFLRDGLEETWKETTHLHEQMMLYLQEDDENFNDDWIEELGNNVNTCLSNVVDYLVERQNDPPSFKTPSQADNQSLNGSYSKPALSDNPEQSIDLNKWIHGETGYETSSKDAYAKFDRENTLALSIPDINKEYPQLTDEKQQSNTKIDFHRLTKQEPFMVDELNKITENFNQLTIANEKGEQLMKPNIGEDEESNTGLNEDLKENLVKSSYWNTSTTKSVSTTESKAPNHNQSCKPQSQLQHVEFNPYNVNQFGVPNRNLMANRNIQPKGILCHNSKLTQPKEVASYNFLKPIFSNIESTTRYSSGNTYNQNVNNPYVSTNETVNHHHASRNHATDNLQNNPVKTTDSDHTYEQAVDSWIDKLNPFERTTEGSRQFIDVDEIPMRLLTQQRLPPIKIITFDGRPEDWIEFVVQFYENIHSQPYLTDVQRKTYLLQYLKGEPKRSVQGFGNDKFGYYSALKKLKYMFGQRVAIAQAILKRVTQGRQINNNDFDGLSRFYYTISDCLHTLKRMKYHSDLHSSDVLRQTVQRLPPKLIRKWAEYCFRIRQTEEPSLIHLEKWLQDRVMAMRDPCLMNYPTEVKNQKKNKGESESLRLSSLQTRVDPDIKDKPSKEPNCAMCDKSHRLNKCDDFLAMSGKNRLAFVRKKRLCFNCLRNHRRNKCTSKLNCFIPSCNKNHHTSLHDAFETQVHDKTQSGGKKQEKIKKKQEEKEPTSEVAVTSAHIKVGRKVYLRVVAVKIHGSNGRTRTTYALLDGASESTLIRRDLAEELELTGDEHYIDLGGIKDDGERMKVKRVHFEVSSECGKSLFKVKQAYTIPRTKFKMPSQHLPKNFYHGKEWEYLQGLGISDVDAKDIQLLIGADVPMALLASEVKAGRDGQPYATKTPFGWTIWGVLEGVDHNCFTRTYKIQIKEMDHVLHKKVEQFWTTESFGCQYNHKSPISVQDQKAIKYLEESTKLIDGHFTVPMLWKDDTTCLPNNYHIALRRLDLLFKKFRKDPELYKMYKSNIEDYLNKGYARILSTNEASNTTKRTWYLPHHGVIHPNKPGKVRICFDAASKFKGKSLNDYLITGPDLLNNLVGILIRFRENPIAIVADIEAMYHQINLVESDTDSVRFLWKENLHDETPPITLKMLVHSFGEKDSPCAALFALQKIARDNQHLYNNNVIQTVLENFYMDDLIKSVKDTREAIQLSNDLIKLLKLGGFKLTKFNSNSSDVLNLLPEALKAKQVQKEMDFDDEATNRTLGIKWNIKRDCFVFSTSQKKVTPTKRNILSITSSIFDPLGFLVPFIVNAKILLQEIWRTKCDWDDPVSASLQDSWKVWLKQLPDLSSIQIQRCYNGNEKIVEKELHVFCDASELAYAAAAYIRTKNHEGKIDCNLILAKSRVAPLKKLTLPRLELQGAVLATRMTTFLKDETKLEFKSIRLWSDSMTVLQYLLNEDKRFKTFVSNRISEIRELTDVSSWQHIDGKSNPADLGTRGAYLTDLKPDSIWFKGPSVLYEESTQQNLTLPEVDESQMEIKRNKVVIATTKAIKPLIIYEEFHNYTQLVMIMAWIGRFIKAMKKLSPQHDKSNILSHEERLVGEEYLIKLIQTECFQAEINNIKSKQPLHKDSPLKHLDPFIDDNGILRIGGRLIKSEFQHSAKQIILPRRHYVVRLLIKQLHEKYKHCGREYLLAKLRERFWVPKARSMIKTITRQCLLCQKRSAKPTIPSMGNLPKERLAVNTPPFFNTGIDYFGPIYVKVLRSRAKRWGCVFTCMTTRAIHLEVSESLDTDSFINTLERFINRRGYPNTILSDCGSNFKGAERELKEELSKLKQDKIQAHSSREGFTWKFNPPDAPHMGGAWERMVRTVKQSLRVIMKDQLVNDFTLMTIFTEVESLVNGRPLTYISEDINDLGPLTPNHFLLGRPNPNLSLVNPYEEELDLRKRWHRAQSLTNQFWKRWLREYLPTISTKPKWHNDAKTIGIGDLVLLHDVSSPRGKWPLARVVDVYPGRDGIVRVADVKTKNGTYRRPVHKLHALEI